MSNGKLYEITRENGSYHHTEIDQAEIPVRSRIYEFLSTPGHGYLKVPLSRLRQLKITRRITTSSFIGRTQASLEEDCDCRVFLDAQLDAGERHFYRHRYVEKANQGMIRYNPYWAEHPVEVGSEVELHTGQTGIIESIDRRTTRIKYTAPFLSSYDNGRVDTRTLLRQLLPKSNKGFVIAHPDKGVLIGYDYSHESGRANTPVWSTDEREKAPMAQLHASHHDAKHYMASAGVSESVQMQCRIVEVDKDPWKDFYVTQDIILRAALPSWEIGQKFKEDDIETVSCTTKGGTRYLNYKGWISDEEKDRILMHLDYQPGYYIQVAPAVRVTLMQQYPDRIFTDGNDAYFHRKDLAWYIELVQHAGYVFAKTKRWHDNPLWYDVIQPYMTFAA